MMSRYFGAVQKLTKYEAAYFDIYRGFGSWYSTYIVSELQTVCQLPFDFKQQGVFPPDFCSFAF